MAAFAWLLALAAGATMAAACGGGPAADPGSTRQAPSEGAAGEFLYVVDPAQDGSNDYGVLVVDADSGDVLRRIATGYAPDAALSADGGRLFVSQAPGPGSDVDVLTAVDTGSWEVMAEVEKIRLEMPAYDFALSGEGQGLYTINPWQQALSVVELERGEERRLGEVGGTPARVLVGAKGGG